MEESILKSTKKILGLAEDYTAFDLDIITHINASFSILGQLGIGPPGGFAIDSDAELWTDYPCPADQLHLLKTYIYLKVRILFDPPTTSYLLQAANDQVKEYEWRLNVLREDALMPDEEVELLNESAARSTRLHRALRRQGNALGSEA